jgi:hypothetical protein
MAVLLVGTGILEILEAGQPILPHYKIHLIYSPDGVITMLLYPLLPVMVAEALFGLYLYL